MEKNTSLIDKLKETRIQYEVMATLCTNCEHNPVCQYKSKAIDLEAAHRVDVEDPFAVTISCRHKKAMPELIGGWIPRGAKFVDTTESRPVFGTRTE